MKKNIYTTTIYSNKNHKEKYNAFQERNVKRLSAKYPFLTRGQIKMKVKKLWENIHEKSQKSKMTTVVSSHDQLPSDDTHSSKEDTNNSFSTDKILDPSKLLSEVSETVSSCMSNESNNTEYCDVDNSSIIDEAAVEGNVDDGDNVAVHNGDSSIKHSRYLIDDVHNGEVTHVDDGDNNIIPNGDIKDVDGDSGFLTDMFNSRNKDETEHLGRSLVCVNKGNFESFEFFEDDENIFL